MKLLFSLLTFIALTSSTAFATSNAGKSFCQGALDSSGHLNYSWYQVVRGKNSDYWISFRNAGGLLNEGVCWWHSEWTRNAIYLAVLDPSAPKPTTLQAFAIMDNIMNSREVTVIGGYSSISDFTKDWQSLLQDVLDLRQLRTASDFGWLRGLTGGENENADVLAKRMDALYQQVTVEKKIVFQMLQLPGVDAHGWLVTSMDVLPTGYRLWVIDSNDPTEQSAFEYVRGQTSEGKYYNDPFIAYTQQDEKFGMYETDVKNYCRSLR
jgi:hypothetical protein